MAKYIIIPKENLICQNQRVLKISDYLVSVLLVAVFGEGIEISLVTKPFPLFCILFAS